MQQSMAEIHQLSLELKYQKTPTKHPLAWRFCQFHLKQTTGQLHRKLKRQLHKKYVHQLHRKHQHNHHRTSNYKEHHYDLTGGRTRLPKSKEILEKRSTNLPTIIALLGNGNTEFSYQGRYSSRPLLGNQLKAVCNWSITSQKVIFCG